MVLGHGGRITIGEWCYVGVDTRIWSGASIDIGNRVLISHSVNIFDNLSHPIRASERHEQAKQIFTLGHPRKLSLDDRPIRISDDAWIGACAMVMRGVTIGEGGLSPRAQWSPRTFQPYSIVAGNPATIIRELSPDELMKGHL